MLRTAGAARPEAADFRAQEVDTWVAVEVMVPEVRAEAIRTRSAMVVEAMPKASMEDRLSNNIRKVATEARISSNTRKVARETSTAARILKVVACTASQDRVQTNNNNTANRSGQLDTGAGNFSEEQIDRDQWRAESSRKP